MSKHSKWAKVKNYKGATDAKRSGVFTKHARAIAVSARNGADPSANFQLRMAIDAARADNVPNDNIERAIARGSGADASEQMKEVLYEGFGPGGAALLIEAVTDNPNRTVQNLRNIVSKRGGNLSGSVQWQFVRQGSAWIPKQQIALTGKDAEAFLKLWEELNEDEDVQKVATNATWE